jgi:hypothetical protein
MPAGGHAAVRLNESEVRLMSPARRDHAAGNSGNVGIYLPGRERVLRSRWRVNEPG